jgi:pimeloyl-ACP methyl ester carboxylesterase
MNNSTTPTYSHAPTNAVRVPSGTDFAYRRVDNHRRMPLVLANYFAANMADWDPLIVDGLAADRELITFDYQGIGGSTGTTPATVAPPTVAPARPALDVR